MSKVEVFSAKISPELKKLLDKVCRMAGVKKQFIVEEALREKIEDLLDAYDLRAAMNQAGEFYSWESIKQELQ
jgi:predicted DNA-binding protein